MPVQSIENNALKSLMAQDDVCLLDVRTDEEYVILGHLPGAVLIPIDQLQQRIHELDPAKKTVAICQHGIRSAEAARYMDDLGFQSVYNYEPGMAAWEGPLSYTPCKPA